MATRRETATYTQLNDKIDRGGARFLAHSLGHLMRWCKNNNLPGLTSLVVDNETGLPAEGLTTVEPDKFPAEQQKVFRYDWFSHLPPTIDELGKS